jgi:hypothetical protein
VSIDISTVLGQNITLVYDSLKLQDIDARILKNLISDVRPTVVDNPDLIAVIYPPVQLVIQLADKRIRITHQQHQNIGNLPLWEFAHQCHQLVTESQLIAYGFNYDVMVEITDQNAQEITRHLFISDPQTIDNLLEGHLEAFIPRLKFRRNGLLYDLFLEPLDEQQIKAHMNVHFEEKTLPTLAQLEASYREEFDYFESLLLNKVFNERRDK